MRDGICQCGKIFTKNNTAAHKNQTSGGALRAIMALCDLCKIWQNYFLKIRNFSAQTVIKNTVFEKSWDICEKNKTITGNNY